jgi:hypothetical protein
MAQFPYVSGIWSKKRNPLLLEGMQTLHKVETIVLSDRFELIMHREAKRKPLVPDSITILVPVKNLETMVFVINSGWF